MRLATVTVDGTTSAARVEGEEAVLLPQPDVGALLDSADWHVAAARATGRRVPLDEVELDLLVPRPDKIVCLGLNYASHIAEMGRPTPLHPTLFAKYRGSLIAPHGDIVKPAVSDRLDWEGELGVVIGRPGRCIRAKDALGHIAGYTVCNDITVRDWQRRTKEFLSGKTFESTTPVGPHLVTADEIATAEPDLRLQTTVDGVVVQDARTSDLLFGIAEILEYVSTIITLLPGDIIMTGTPGGVGDGRTPPAYLQPQQVVGTSIELLGSLRNVVIEEPSRPDPRPAPRHR